MDKIALSAQLKSIALKHGFTHCGIAKAEFLASEAPKLEQWLLQGKHGQMTWMEHHFDMRLDPRVLMPGTKSVVSVLINYFPQSTESASNYKVAKYAQGRDYHKVIRQRLKRVVQDFKALAGEFQYRICVDSAPIMDKAWALRSGLGWIGKNTNLIHKKAGSFFLIGEILLDIDLEYDHPQRDYCGTCRRCVDACPTDALQTPYQIDAHKCVSYLTIELKEQIPTDLNWNDWIFGCDICQDVCPWNKLSKPTLIDDFKQKAAFAQLTDAQWEALSATDFASYFEGTPLKRTGYNGLSRNIVHVKAKAR